MRVGVNGQGGGREAARGGFTLGLRVGVMRVRYGMGEGRLEGRCEGKGFG